MIKLWPQQKWWPNKFVVTGPILQNLFHDCQTVSVGKMTSSSQKYLDVTSTRPTKLNYVQKWTPCLTFKIESNSLHLVTLHASFKLY